MTRYIEAEWLDHLPPNDPDATASRADLRRINWIMGNHRTVSRALLAASRPAPAPFRVIVELGGGDGTFLLKVIQASGLPAEVRAILIDRQRTVSDRTQEKFRRIGRELEVVTEDVLDWLADSELPRPACILANLFLHHFDDIRLRQLLSAIALRCDYFIACEPRRSLVALAGARLTGLIGCNRVTRHDAAVSVHAGFTGSELSVLWPTQLGWRVLEGLAPPFSHSFVAQRESGPAA